MHSYIAKCKLIACFFPYVSGLLLKHFLIFKKGVGHVPSKYMCAQCTVMGNSWFPRRFFAPSPPRKCDEVLMLGFGQNQIYRSLLLRVVKQQILLIINVNDFEINRPNPKDHPIIPSLWNVISFSKKNTADFLRPSYL